MRIASLSPAVTEILCALGAGRDIVCTDQFSNFPDETKKCPHVPDHQKVDIEEIKKHNPDVIFTSTIIQEALAKSLKAAGLPGIHQDPRTLEQIYESIRAISMVVAKEPQAKELIASMRKGFNEVEKKAKMMQVGRDLRFTRLYIEEWHQPPFASGNWVPEVARIAGGEQFPVAPGALSPEVTLEQVAQWNPDLIVISWCGAGSLAPKELLMKRLGWDQLSAIQKGNVRVIDDSLLNRPGPRLVEGAQRLYGWMFEITH